MTILGIETSCDETSVAILECSENSLTIKSNIVASSLEIHSKTGGVIPENAARAQLTYMLPVLQEALLEAFGLTPQQITKTPPPIDAIAVTFGPGLIGPLLVGTETARTLSYVWHKPLIPVNHMLGHIYANFISPTNISNGKMKNDQMINEKIINFPLIALVVSGGHTDLIYMKKHGHYQVLGGTRDDAAGEAFDKIGRLLGLPYPAGPVIEKRAASGNAEAFNLPSPLIHDKSYDFSFSGLKTAVLNVVKKIEKMEENIVNDIAAGTQKAIIDVLIKKTLRAAEEYNAKSILLSGGVAANQTLREIFQSEILKRKINSKLYFPPKNLCTDNAAMIAAAGFFNYNPVPWKKLAPNPELYY